MYSIVDSLIFPAPKPSYTHESLAGKLIYVPKCKQLRSERFIDQQQRLLTNVATNAKSLHDENLSAFNSHTFDQSIKGPIMGRKGRPVAQSTNAGQLVRALTRSPNAFKQTDEQQSPSSVSGRADAAQSQAPPGASRQGSSWKSPKAPDTIKVRRGRGSREANITTPTRRTVMGQQQTTIRQDFMRPFDDDTDLQMQRPLASSFLHPEDFAAVEVTGERLSNDDDENAYADFKKVVAKDEQRGLLEPPSRGSRIVNATRAISPLDIKARQRAVERLRSLQERVAKAKGAAGHQRVNELVQRSCQPSLRGSVDNSMASMHNMHQRLQNLEPAEHEPDADSGGTGDGPDGVKSITSSPRQVPLAAPRNIGAPAPPTPSLATTQARIGSLKGHQNNSVKQIKQQLYTKAAAGLSETRNEILYGKPNVSLSIVSGEVAADSPTSNQGGGHMPSTGAAALHRKILSMSSPNAHLSEQAMRAHLKELGQKKAGGGLFSPQSDKKLQMPLTEGITDMSQLHRTVGADGLEELSRGIDMNSRADFNRTQNAPSNALLIEEGGRNHEMERTQKFDRNFATAAFRSNPSQAAAGMRSMLDENVGKIEPATTTKQTHAHKLGMSEQNTHSKAPESIRDQRKLLAEEEEKLLRMQSEVGNYGKRDYIPCLFYKGRSDKVMIHFHANGEDIGLTQPLMNKIVERCHVNILCVEYPGYGVYQEFGEQQRARQILDDATCVYEFLRDTCQVSERNIIIMGRSIGSGPACHLAKTFKNALALVLISPIKSVIDVARQKYGRIVDLLLEERFNNFEAAKQVTCPTVIFHGIKDSMVPYQNSIEMLLQAFTRCEAHMFLREDMEHNKFNYTRDIIDPLRYFFRVNQIRVKGAETPKAVPVTGAVPQSEGAIQVNKLDEKVLQYKQRGYVDWKALADYHEHSTMSKSQYYNNHDEKFKAELPQRSPKGTYIEQDFPFQSAALLDQEQVLSPMMSSVEGDALSGNGGLMSRSRSRRSSMYSSTSEVPGGSGIGVGLTSQKSLRVVQLLVHQKKSLQQEHPPFGKFEPRNLRDQLSTSHVGESLNASLSQAPGNQVLSGEQHVRLSTLSKDQYLTQQKTSVPILSKQQKQQRSASGDSDGIRLPIAQALRADPPTVRSKEIVTQAPLQEQRPRSPTGVPAQDDSCRVDTNEEDIADSPNQADMAAAPADLDRADGQVRAQNAFKLAVGVEWDNLPEGIENVKDSHIQRADEDIDASARQDSSKRVVRAVVTALASGGAQHAEEGDEIITARDGGVGELLKRFVSERSQPSRMGINLPEKASSVLDQGATINQYGQPKTVFGQVRQQADRIGTLATPAAFSPLDMHKNFEFERKRQVIVPLHREGSQPVGATRSRQEASFARPRSSGKPERDTIDALPPGLKSPEPLVPAESTMRTRRERSDNARRERSIMSAFGSTARVDDNNASPAIRNWPVGVSTPFKTRRLLHQQKLRFQTKQRRLRRKQQELNMKHCFDIGDFYFRPPDEQISQSKDMLGKRLQQVREELKKKEDLVKKVSDSQMKVRQRVAMARNRQHAATLLEVKRQSEQAMLRGSNMAQYGAAKVLAIKLTRHDQVEKPAQHQLDEEQLLMGSQVGSDRDTKQSQAAPGRMPTSVRSVVPRESKPTEFFEDERNAFGIHDTTESQNKNYPIELKETGRKKAQPRLLYGAQDQHDPRLDVHGSIVLRQAQSAACRSDEGDRDLLPSRPTFGDSCEQLPGSGPFTNEDSQSISLPNETRTPMASDGRGLLRSRHKGVNNKARFKNLFNSRSDVDRTLNRATDRQEDGPPGGAEYQPNLSDNYFISESGTKRQSSRKALQPAMASDGPTDRSAGVPGTLTLSQQLRLVKDGKQRARRAAAERAELVSRTLDEGPRGGAVKFKPARADKRDTSAGQGSLIRKKVSMNVASPTKIKIVSQTGKDLKLSAEKSAETKAPADFGRAKPKPKRLERPPQPAAGGSGVSSLAASGVVAVKSKQATAPRRVSRKTFGTSKEHQTWGAETQGPPSDRKSLMVGQESKINKLGDIQQSSAATPGLAERRRSTLRSERQSVLQKQQQLAGLATTVKNDPPANMRQKWQQDATHALSAIMKSEAINQLPRQPSQQTSIQSIKVSRSKKVLVKSDSSMLQQMHAQRPKKHQFGRHPQNAHKAQTAQTSHTQLPSARTMGSKQVMSHQGPVGDNRGSNHKLSQLAETRRATQQLELDVKSQITSPPRELRTKQYMARNAKQQAYSQMNSIQLLETNQARMQHKLTRNAEQPRDNGESESVAPLNTLGTFGSHVYLQHQQDADIRTSDMNLKSAPAAQGYKQQRPELKQPNMFELSKGANQQTAASLQIHPQQASETQNQTEVDSMSKEHNFIMNQPIMINNSVLHNAVITINIHQNDSVHSVQQQVQTQAPAEPNPPPQQPQRPSGGSAANYKTTTPTQQQMSDSEIARMIERNRKKVQAYLDGSRR